jgi:hypothetical protein
MFGSVWISFGIDWTSFGIVWMMFGLRAYPKRAANRKHLMIFAVFICVDL